MEPKVHAWVVPVMRRQWRAAGLIMSWKAVGPRPAHGIRSGSGHHRREGLPPPGISGGPRLPMRMPAVSEDPRAGAVIMGKTVTTLRLIDPAGHSQSVEPQRTPGGSSRPHAAVACGMCLAAIGTQTGGSITRPASFCGVAGMKPTRRGASSSQGVKPFAPSLDHVGPIARTVGDLRLLFDEMPWLDSKNKDQGVNLDRREGPPRLGRLRGFFESRAEPAVQFAFDDAVRALHAQRPEVAECRDPIDQNGSQGHRCVMAAGPRSAPAGSTSPDDYLVDPRPYLGRAIADGVGVLASQESHASGRELLVAVPLWTRCFDHTRNHRHSP